MRNGERGGTFRYATLTRDRFFSLIRHSTLLMITLDAARGVARRFFFFFSSSSPFCLFLLKWLHNNRPYSDHGAPLNLNYYMLRRSFPVFPHLLRLSQESLQLPITTYNLLTYFICCRDGFIRFLFFLLSYYPICSASETIFK